MNASNPPPSTSTPASPQAVAAQQTAHCSNCGVELLGPHCHACGQPVKGLVRHFSSIMGDFFDSVFDLDSRLLRTLWPLFARPGFLSREYFAGHRVRFVSPVRLFVFFIVLAFFLAQISFDWSGTDVLSGESRFDQAKTVEDVERIRDETIAELQRAAEASRDVPGVAAGLNGAKLGVRAEADARIKVIRAATTDGSERQVDDPRLPMYVNGERWDRESNPLRINWLPEFANTWLNDRLAQTEKNVARIHNDPNLLKNAWFGLMPQVLFVMLPLFALLLKVFFLFRRRLYMEHLIVALHSHAFLALSIGLLLLADLARAAAAPDGWLDGILFWVEVLLWIWMPLYLLLMQKRVYQQGWIMTLLKYSVLGVVYITLLNLAMAMAFLLSVAML